ncbi:MAG: V4R domain-containing protein [Thermoplasmatota archaeon]
MDKVTKIFATDEGVVVIKGPTKNQIVQLLREGEKTSKEIREQLGKAKSTISVHLSDLEKIGVIKEKKHPNDKRKKIFYINSKLLGKSETPYDEHYEAILRKLRKRKDDSYGFLQSLFHLVRYGLTSFGLDIHPALKEIGRDAGKNIGKDFESTNLKELMEEIQGFWSGNKLGNIDFDGENHIIVYDCFDCCDMPDVGETFCSLDEGLIEGIIEERLNLKVSVKEKECFGTGDNRCKFKIQVLKD